MGYESQQTEQQVNDSSFPLAFASTGENVRIVTIRSGGKMKKRLFNIGLQIDDIIEVVQCRQRGSVLIGKNDNRFILGGGMAQKIHVVKE